MKLRFPRIALVACGLVLYSAAALAIVIPPPYGTLRTYYDHPTGIVKGQYMSCGELSTFWGTSRGWSYFDKPIQCP